MQTSEKHSTDYYAQQLYDELVLSGYSLTFDDVLKAVVLDTQYYASWAKLDHLNELQIFEWGIIEPVVRSHCDLLQARLMEATRSLGGDGFGLSVSEANTIYNEVRKNMQFEAFIEPPFTLEIK